MPLCPRAPLPVDIAEYLRKFTWDVERFDATLPLPELAKTLMTLGEKIDSDIRGFVTAYSERKQALAAMARRQTYAGGVGAPCCMLLP